MIKICMARLGSLSTFVHVVYFLVLAVLISEV